jgi:hypothetical protein
MFFVIAVILFVAAEFVIGWWALPVIGVILGVIGARRRGVALQVGGAALVAWGLLFAWVAMHGDLQRFLAALALSMKLKPGQLIFALTVVPALLAGPAAGLGSGLRNLIQTPPKSAVTAA